MNYKRHKLSELFPDMTKNDMNKLTDSISEYGFDKNHPITLYDGEILDGWHRYQACDNIGVTAVFDTFTGTMNEAHNFVIRENLERRHLSPDDKLRVAMASEDFITALLAERPKGRPTINSESELFNGDKGFEPKPLSKTHKVLADKFNVGQTRVAQQLKIKKSSPEIHDAFMVGDISHEDEKKILELDKSAQDKVLETVKSTDKPKVKDIIEKAENKKTAHVSHNSGDNEWYTPEFIIKAARDTMGSIDLDPASTDIANDVVKATRFYTIEDDGLKQTWQGNVWMNPPYDGKLIKQFITKLCESDINQAVILINNATETKWFTEVINKASMVCFPEKRVKFWHPVKISAPLQGQAILYIGDNIDAFISNFRNIGVVCRVIH